MKRFVSFVLFASLCLIPSAAWAQTATAPVLSPLFTLPAPAPLGILHLSDPSRITKENPAGFFLETGGAPGSDAWQDGYLDRALPVIKKCGMQGVLIWDIEGSSLGAPAQYVGMPELAAQLNPTFNYPRFFKRLRSEGLSFGVCIRANQKIVDGKPMPVPAKDMFEHVRRQAAFAVNEWKCTWLYVDSNVRDALPDVPNAWADGWLMPNTAWPRLRREFPECIFIPEHKDAATYLWTMPYHELRRGTPDIPFYVQKDIPRAVGLINCSGIVADELRKSLPALRASVRAGNLLALDAWFESPETAAFAEIYRSN